MIPTEIEYTYTIKSLKSLYYYWEISRKKLKSHTNPYNLGR